MHIMGCIQCIEGALRCAEDCIVCVQCVMGCTVCDMVRAVGHHGYIVTVHVSQSGLEA